MSNHEIRRVAAILDNDGTVVTSLEENQATVSAFIEAEMYDPDHLPSWKIAQAFNVDVQVVQAWVAQGLPQLADGTFSWVAVMEWKMSGLI
jgi:hypothetical protein